MNATPNHESGLPDAERRREIMEWARRVLHEAIDIKERLDAADNALGNPWIASVYGNQRVQPARYSR